jgi:hypothetical protein
VSFYLFTFGVAASFMDLDATDQARDDRRVAVYALASLGCVFAPNMTVLGPARSAGDRAGGGVLAAPGA